VRHTTFDELKPVASVTPIPTGFYRRELRRRRLERLALLLEEHQDLIRLFSQIEYMAYSKLCSLRSDNSPLSIAFADPILRSQGLKSDEFGDAVKFFDITRREAHHLLCDCHYDGAWPSSEAIAARARWLANRITLRDRWEKLRRSVVAWL